MAKPHILIAEDDVLLAQDIQNRLESLNYEVCARTAFGQEAVTLARALNPDLVLMDIQLPGQMDGIQAADQIRTFQVPVVFVTGYWDSAILDRAKQSQPYGYLRKPFETIDLKIGIELGLQRHDLDRARQHTADQLQQELANTKTLTGLLPICCYCKNIKEDSGEWERVEAYIMKRTNASFTHGMCPDCFKRIKRQLDTLQKPGTEPPSIILG